MNQGAESVICALLALLAVSKQIEKEERTAARLDLEMARAVKVESAR
jgi:hypothetical protein